MSERLLHEWPTDPTAPYLCVHCGRHSGGALPREECAVRLRAALDGERAAVAADLMATARAYAEAGDVRLAAIFQQRALRVEWGAHLPPTPESR